MVLAQSRPEVTRMTRMIGPATLLERHGQRRADAAWIAGLIAGPGAGVLVLADGRAVIDSNAECTEARIRWLPPARLSGIGLSLDAAIFLGTSRETGAGRFALPVPAHVAVSLSSEGGPLYPAADVRSLAMQAAMPAAELALVAEAKAVTSWAEATRCCGRCGAHMRPRDGGWRRQCTACGTVQFPRVDPVVIMLVTDGERAVLSHEPRFPEGMLSTIAGYIEPGEDIAHAVARETREELGLDVLDVRYQAAQPWPFPHSLMIGCVARAAPAEIAPDPEEIAFARWFSRDEVRQVLARAHPEGFWVPGPMAIAHWLIRDWAEG